MPLVSTTQIQYVLLTGSDLGNRGEILEQAAILIQKHIGTILKKSEVLETEPWGFQSETKFLNQALLIESDLSPEHMLSEILRLEESLGRIRESNQWASRTIDIDILCGHNLIYDSESLSIPHKHLHERLFALEPLCQLVPNWQHPVLKKTFAELLLNLKQLELSNTQPS